MPKTPGNQLHSGKGRLVWRRVYKVAAFVAVFFLTYQTYLYFIPHARIDFVTFVPLGLTAYGPEEVVETPEVYMFGKYLDTIVAPKVSVEYDLPLEVGYTTFRVYQSRNPSFNYDCRLAFAAHCGVYTTPHGQKYLFAVDDWYTPKSYVEQFVYLDREGTYTEIKLGGTSPRTQSQWEKLIDSLEPTKFPDLPVRRMHPGP